MVLVFGSDSSFGKGFWQLFAVGILFNRPDGSGVGSRKTVPTVPVPFSVSGEMVLTVPVSSFGLGSWAILPGHLRPVII